MTIQNIAQKVLEVSKLNPTKIAVKFPYKTFTKREYSYTTLSFKELEFLIFSYSDIFLNSNIKKGDRVSVFIKPSLHFSSIVFALFYIGAIPVFIDPGMGIKNVLKSLRTTQPTAIISEGTMAFLSIFFKNSFKTIRTHLTVSRFNIFNFKSVKQEIEKQYNKPLNIIKDRVSAKLQETLKDDKAAILFTSGGTGIPKGVVYSHKIFLTQTKVLQNIFNLTDRDVDLPGFPLFSLFTIAMGMTSCIPDLNPSKPIKANPKKIIQNIKDSQASFVAGSPAIWNNIRNYCVENNCTLPSVKYLVMFGAPVENKMHLDFQKILPNGDTYTPYGATESLPISCINGSYILKNTANKSLQGSGTCVGQIGPGVNVKIIKIHNGSIDSIENITELKKEEIGEIIVRGDIVTQEYDQMTEQTKLSKIYDINTNSYWHRIGDVGYLDTNNLLWFCGRKSHIVKSLERTYFSIPCETIANNHDLITRCALIGPRKRNNKTGQMEIVPTILIESKKSNLLSIKNKNKLVQFLNQFKQTMGISSFEIYPHFPVDIRHNIKIDRIKLGQIIEDKWKRTSWI